jgi:hypothetical protein
MKKIIFTTIFSFLIFEGKTQTSNILLGGNIGITRYNAVIGYQLDTKNWKFSYQFGYGVVGHGTFDENTQDGYANIYQDINLSTGYFKRHGYKHNFVGITNSLLIQRKLYQNEKISFHLGIGGSLYNLKDNYEYYYTLTPDDSDIQTDSRKVKSTYASLDLGLFFNYSISSKIKVQLAFITPFYAPILPSGLSYTPIDNSFPLIGFEPILQIGMIYKLKRNDDDTTK